MKLPRAERIAAITKLLVDNPWRLFGLSEIGSPFGSARSTASEDVAIVKKSLEGSRMGRVETVAGAAGGVRYVPHVWQEDLERIREDLVRELSDPRRLLPGGFIYMTDILFSPAHMDPVASVFASRFAGAQPDSVLTVETKGIPLAFTIARLLGVPLAISRREGRAEEGPVVTINYVSGSTRRVQTMSLARRALSPGVRVLIMDDFMKGGGRATGMTDLVSEFQGVPAGVGVLIATAEPRDKMVSDYCSLLTLVEVDESGKQVVFGPGKW